MKNPHIQNASCAVVCADSKRDNQRGSGLVEYALVVALIAVVGISGVKSIGLTLQDKFDTAATAVLEAGAGSGCDPVTDPFCNSYSASN